jgi:asparagine synthase (glutamine-hydrolysing)
MCGIIGIAGKSLRRQYWQENINKVDRMLNTILYRGPDSKNVVQHRNKTVVFGMNTLSIVDSHYGSGPFRSQDAMITFNGEIYNYQLLGKEWGVTDIYNRSDTDVILQGYRQEGVDFVKRLEGMFAFAIHDSSNDKIILYRDRLGEKPLYYKIKTDTLSFASESKALVVDEPAAKVISEEYLAYETPVGTKTPYKDIYLLEPGMYLEFDLNTGEINKNQYWSLENTNNPTLKNPNDNIDLLEDLLRKAVDKTKINPNGLMLSGGIDSAVLAYLLHPEIVFTSRYPGKNRFDESSLAKMVSENIGARHIFIEPNANDFKSHMETIVSHLDYPMANSSAFSEYMTYKAMANENLRVAFGGIGIDEILLGYMRHLLMFGGSLENESIVKAYQPLNRLFNERTNSNMTDAEKYFQLTLRGPIYSNLPFEYLQMQFNKGLSLAQSLTQVDIAISFPPLLLTSDKLSGAFGMEKRSPFLDHHLVEFMYWLPDAQKIDQYGTKKIFRKIAEKLGVPKPIWQTKDKVGFSTPTSNLLNGELSSWFKGKVKNVNQHPQLKSLFYTDQNRGSFDRSSFQLLQFALWGI